MGKRLRLTIISLFLFLSILQAGSNRQNMEYSLVLPSANKLISFLNKNKISKKVMQQVYKDPYYSPKNSFLYALAYDYSQNRADLGQYYRIAINHDISIGKKSAFYEYLDYLLRTNKIDKISQMLSSSKCLNTGDYPRCFYYIGIAKYLKTGKCNTYLKIAANHGIQKGLFYNICKK